MNLPFGLRNLRRVREILSVLVKYGFGYALDQLGVSRLLPLGRRRAMAAQYGGMPGPQRLRLALAELGPTFIKLGQVLSARGDLFPAPLIAELRLLQDQGPEVPFEQIRGVVEAELGRPIEACFSRFDEVPLSSASIGQVHTATLRDGREVTVKVRRPGVEKVIEADLQIFSEAASLLTRQVRQLRRYDLPGFVRRFASQIEDELVYTIEAYNAQRLGRILKRGGWKVRVPEVVWDLTTRRVLTMERVRGVRVDRLSTAGAQFDRTESARQFGRSFLHQIFVEGFFHGDPHQGNVLFSPEGTALLLDFGIVGYLDPRIRRLLAEAVQAIDHEDVEALVETLSQLGTVGPDTDLVSLRSELAQILGRLLILPPGELKLGDLLMRTLRAMWTNNMRAPGELSLASKALLMAEAVCSELDPSFDLRDEASAVVDQARRRLLAPQVLYERALAAAELTGRRLLRVPAHVDRVLTLLEQGSLRIRLDEPDAEQRWENLARSLNRVALGVLAGALFVGGAVLLAGTKHPVPVGLGIAAVASGIALGLVVLVALLRLGRL